MISSTLTEAEYFLGAVNGVCRQIRNRKNNCRSRPGINEAKDGWQYSIDGTLAEKAVAKYLNVFFAENGRPGGLDAGPYQVRSTWRSNGCLVLHENEAEPPEQKWILVLTYDAPTYYLAGWLYGWEGTQQKYWREDVDRPSFFNPQSILHSMETIKQPPQRLFAVNS